MTGNSHVITSQGSNHGISFQAAFHRSIPELRATADTAQSALDRLAWSLALNLDCATDDFHRELIQRALDDVDHVRSAR
jgi:hypothetical protein